MRCHSFCIAYFDFAQHELLQKHAPTLYNEHIVLYICNLSEVNIFVQIQNINFIGVVIHCMKGIQTFGDRKAKEEKTKSLAED